MFSAVSTTMRGNIMKYYRIAEFADLSGLSESALRLYDKNGIFVPIMRTPTGIRLYSEEQLEDALVGNFSKWSHNKDTNASSEV